MSPRLPTPGSDNGQWGEILNDYLTQTLDNNGAIKPGIITENQLDSSVRDKLNTAGSGNVADDTITTTKLSDGAVTDAKVSASAAIAQSKIANLTTDLAGKASTSHAHTIANVTGLQTALDSKQATGSYAPTSHGHVATDITSGTVATARLGSGTASATTFLRGDSTWAVLDTGGAAVTALQSTTISNSYTLALSDAGKVVESQSASAITVTIPSNASVAFPVGTVIEIYRYGVGSVVLAAGSGATLLVAGNRTTLAEQYSSVSLRKRSTNEWTAVGDLL